MGPFNEVSVTQQVAMLGHPEAGRTVWILKIKAVLKSFHFLGRWEDVKVRQVICAYAKKKMLKQ